MMMIRAFPKRLPWAFSQSHLWGWACRAGRLIAIGLLLLLAAAPLGAVEGVWVGYFPPPPVTPRVAAYLVDFRIDGVGARPGDEIVFSDPQGVICGRRLVAPSDTVSTLLVAVYGDDPETEAIDEGAADGDVLTVRIWQAATGREFAGASVSLAPGSGQYENFPPSPIPPVWHYSVGALEAHSLNVDTATHFTLPPPNTSFVEYVGSLAIRGAPADIGDEVAVYDPQGVLCGFFRVHTPGVYGYLRVYGDDSTTETGDEGATEGDLLAFRVWDRSAGIEYTGSDIVFTAGAASGSFVPSELPPLWRTTVDGYVLDISVATSSAVAGDVNHNAVVDLADAVLALRILAGWVPALPSVPKAADVSGDGRIGLAEVLFILQSLGSLR